MIMTIEEFRLLNDTDDSDGIIKMKLEALELMIRKYTNNNFQMRNFRTTANIKDGRFSFNGPQFLRSVTLYRYLIHLLMMLYILLQKQMSMTLWLTSLSIMRLVYYALKLNILPTLKWELSTL